MNPGNLVFNFVLSANRSGLENTLQNLANQDPKKAQDIVNSFDEEGNSPLHYASQYNEILFLEILAKYGADLRIRNNKKNTPLHSAAQTGAHDAILWLISKDESLIHCENQWQETPLHLISHTGDLMSAKAFLKAFLVPEKISTFEKLMNAKDKWSRDCLEVAKQHGENEFVVFLKDPKSYIKKFSETENENQNENQNQIENQKMQKGHKSLSKLMEAPLDEEWFLSTLSKSRDNNFEFLNGRDYYGLSAVHKCAAWNKDKCLTMLMKHPDFERNSLRKQSNGQTPLLLACESNALNAVEVLLNDEIGKSAIYIPGPEGVVPTFYALENELLREIFAKALQIERDQFLKDLQIQFQQFQEQKHLEEEAKKKELLQKQKIGKLANNFSHLASMLNK